LRAGRSGTIAQSPIEGGDVTQPIAEVAFAALLGGLLGLPFRAFRRAPLGALFGAAVGGGVAWRLQAPCAWALLAALAGGALALLLPGVGAWRRGEWSFAGLAGRASSGGAAAPGRISKIKPSVLLDPADRLRVERAVLEAEQNTAGEIVVAVVGSCAEYGSAGWRLGAAMALLGFLAAEVFTTETGPGTLLGAQAAGLALGHLLARIQTVRRSLVSDRCMQECAERRAWSAFAQNGLARTAERTGILIFVALFEHRVIVLGDEGVDRVLDPGESWEEVVDLLLAGVRERRITEGILAAVRRCGEILQAHLPAPPKPVNQLPTALILED
jgi:putative membrane protein